MNAIPCSKCLMHNNYDHCAVCRWRKGDSMEGRKDDNQKLRYDLVPVDALREVVRVYTFGAGKYDDRNWENGIKYGRVYAAAQRHLNAFWDGEALDKESSIAHLAHAAWNCLSLLAYELRGMKQFDDRPNAVIKEIKDTADPTYWQPNGLVHIHEWSEIEGGKRCRICGKKVTCGSGPQEL